MSRKSFFTHDNESAIIALPESAPLETGFAAFLCTLPSSFRIVAFLETAKLCPGLLDMHAIFFLT